MPPSEIAAGHNRGWTLIQKLGEGDAGEIFRVEALMDGRPAILKRPRRGAFPSDLIRQATQIEKEGRILRALARRDPARQLPFRTPALLDWGKAGTEFSERYFIVMAPATGLDLARLARLIHVANLESAPGDGPPTPENAASLLKTAGEEREELSPTDEAFLLRLANTGEMPDLLLLRAVTGLIDFLEAIHAMPVETPSGKAGGILWNDIKPEHFFWDPVETSFTIIDWGNAQFLESDGTTKDRQHSRMHDYIQVLESMGRFIADTNPDLYTRLDWPTGFTPASVYSQGIVQLRETASQLLEQETQALNQARREEADILGTALLESDQLELLGSVQTHIASFGEVPDQVGADLFFRRLAQSLVINKDLEGFHRLCQVAVKTPILPGMQAAILDRLGERLEQGDIPAQCLLAALDGDWPAVLWELRRSSLKWPEPDWWDELSSLIRKQETGSEALRPVVALNRLIHALQAASQRLNNREAYDAVITPLKEEVLPRWLLLEPDPPDSSIEYREIDRHLPAAKTLLNEAAQTLENALEQPRMQVELALQAWSRKDLPAVHRALQGAIFWDPERRRFLHADRLIESAPAWLAEVRRGMTRDEPLQDLVARLELSGREFRSGIGPAPWLDALLEAFKQLRRGSDPADVLVTFPEVRDELGWLIAMEPKQPLLASPNKFVRPERMPVMSSAPGFHGMKEAPLGNPRGLLLGQPLDTWAPEARGSSARLFLGKLASPAGAPVEAAIKLMRPDRIDYALPLFREEARILNLLRDVPGVVPMLEAGFIRLENGQGAKPSLPPEDRHASAENLTGQMQRYGLDSLHNYLADLDKQVDQGWIPYLAIEKQEKAENLLLHVDTGYTGGRFLPILEGLVISLQICDILEAAHSRNIIYRDHKILHYYWRESLNGVFAIDWNVAKRFPQGLSAAEVQFDLVQFGARALHYIFTGRPAPGALPMGPNRPEEIEAAAHSYTTQWTYDDQRLPKDIKDLLEAVLAGQYASSRALREVLQTAYDKFSALVVR